MKCVVLSDYFVEYSDVEVFPVAIVIDGGRSCMCNIDDIWVLHSHPGCEHASIAASEDNNWTISAVGLFDKLNELNEVHHGLFSGEEDEVFFGSRIFLISEGPAFAEIAMFRVE